ncbi:TetR/AcrR family transcriptional regulator [Clostridium sp.]|uniref:TetR/AcrR family transcriptional regulator n=1 Tax=Clostridium sp. TaxID=1506 RepID=UPI00258A0EE5|nr:TetR/AcrR family transcriptional regulator [Clostridium sp.]MDF2504229.1 putative transcriptional regulator [Clostridium sp.]
MTKDNYHHGTLKQDLIDKGLQLLNKEGYEDFSLRKVAALCGVSHSAPYKHFKNKDELISTITLNVINSFKDSLNEIVDKYSNPKTQIIEMGKQYIKFMVKNPDYLKFMFLSDFNKTIIVKENEFINAEDTCFDIFKESAINYFKFINANQANYTDNILIMWSLVHGMALLIANKNIQLSENYLKLIDKTLNENLKF